MKQRIDVHTHILPRDIPKFKERYGYGGFITLIESIAAFSQPLRERLLVHNALEWLGKAAQEYGFDKLEVASSVSS